MKWLKLLLQVLANTRLKNVARGPSLLDSTQKELANETLMKINVVISAQLRAVEVGLCVYEAGYQWIPDILDR